VSPIIAKPKTFSFLPFTRLFLVVAAIATTSCALGPRPLQPVALTLQISANTQINPDINGRPSPVMVRIYELKSTARFSSADFFSLFDKDTATLGDDISGKEEFMLYPGETRVLTKPGHAGTIAIGVLIAYRDLEKSIWRTTHAVSPASEVSYFSGIPVISGMLKPDERYAISIEAQQVSISR
jgi:type VI secretion system protein VasD